MRDYVAQSGAKVSGAMPDGEDHPEKELTRRIIGCAVAVHKTLGPGYLEVVYENALAQELQEQGLKFERQKVVKVLYHGREVGEHRIDLLVEGKVVVELKSVEDLAKKHVAQVISTLKAADARVALLMNFNEAKMVDGVRRVVL
jgi:GxxExxY protein